MSIKKRGHGPVATVNAPRTRHRRSLSAPIDAGVIFPRPDVPFQGDGQRIELRRVKGYTPQGWLSTPFRFQLPPNEAVTRTAAHNWAAFDVLDSETGSSERSRSGGPRLRSKSIQTFFMLETEAEQSALAVNPNVQPDLAGMPSKVTSALPFAVWSPGPGLMNPILAVRELEMMVLKGVRFHLRMWNPSMYEHDDVNWATAVATQVQITEQPGEPDTRYLQIDFQEYKPTEVERKAVKNEVGPWTHTIKSGDSLYRLARKYYKSAHQWQRIAHGNKGLEHEPPSHNLITWAKKHHRKTIHIPQATDARVPVSV